MHEIINVLFVLRIYHTGVGFLSQPPKPRCGMFYNVFYAADPLAYRIEPLLEEKLAKIPPILIPRFRTYPMGDGTSIKVTDSLTKHVGLFYPYCDIDVNDSGGFSMSEQQKHSQSLSSLDTEDAREPYPSLAVNPSTTLASKHVYTKLFVLLLLLFIYLLLCIMTDYHYTHKQEPRKGI